MADPEHHACQDLASILVLVSPVMDVSSGKVSHESEDFAAFKQSDDSIKVQDQPMNSSESSAGERIYDQVGVLSEADVSSSNSDSVKQERDNHKRFDILKDDESVNTGEQSSSEIGLPSVSPHNTTSGKDMLSETLSFEKEKDNKFMKLKNSLSENFRSSNLVRTSEGDGVPRELQAPESIMDGQYSTSKLNTVAVELEPRPFTSELTRQSSLSKLNAEAPAFVPKGLTSFQLSPGEGSSPRSPNPRLISPPALQSLHPLSQQLETYSVTTLGFHAPVAMLGSSHSFSSSGSQGIRLSGTISASRSWQPIGSSASTEHFNAGCMPEHGEGPDVFHTQEEHVSHDMAANLSSVAKSSINEELKTKIVKQVEFYFSDSNLPTDNYLMKFVKKDPEGFVPLPVIASFRKVKALSKNHAVVAAALRTSSSLVVSEDGKKVRRAEPLPEIDLEEIQSRSVVVENLPEDHSVQNMEQLFGTVGNVKLVRICQPEAANGLSQTAAKFSRTDLLVSNKLHAVVEYESVEEAERAVAELTDERNWRSGLRVRLLLRRTGKHAYRRRSGNETVESNEADEEGIGSNGALEKFGDEQIQQTEMEEHQGDIGAYERDGRRGRGRNRGRGRGRGQHIMNTSRGHPRGTPPQPSSPLISEFVVKPPPGPRMPDGTRGFTLGRGKLLSADTHPSVVI